MFLKAGVVFLNVCFITFVATIVVSINFIYGTKTYDMLSIGISYLPLVSIFLYALFLSPLALPTFSFDVSKDSIQCTFALFLFLIFYLLFSEISSVFNKEILIIFQLFMTTITLLLHIKVIRSLVKINPTELKKYKKFIFEYSNPFYDGRKIKATRKYKFIAKVLVFIAFSTWNVWVLFMFSMLYFSLYILEAIQFVGEYKDTSMLRYVLKYELVELLMLSISLILYICSYQSFATLMFLCSDICYHMVKGKVFSKEWNQLHSSSN